MRFDHPALPPRVARPWLAGTALVWALAGLLGGASGPPAPAGWVESEGVALIAPRDGPYGRWALVAAGDHQFLLELDGPVEFRPGDRVGFSGVSDGTPGRVAGRAHHSSVAVADLRVSAPDGSISQRLGGAVRERVLTRLEPYDEGRGLLAGFLIGDTGHVTPSDTVAMRRSGLAHFVAVSGSNVTLFLGLVFVAAGPLATGPRRRALLGLAGLPVYAAATGFEPSVMRASAMAGLALGGRLIGVVLETWQLLALSVAILLAADHELTGSLGFQLSVAATAGVVIGARWPVPPGKVPRVLAVTMGAQLAVAPLLLVVFGTVPLFSPLANLLAAPLVAASTVVGAVGVVGPEFLIDLAGWLAQVVLWVARGAAVWPQLDVWGVLGILAAVALAVRLPSFRVPAAVVATGLIATLVLGLWHRPPDPGVVVLSVGQGDAVLVHGGASRFALVDGGPDPTILVDALRRYGVDALDLVVLTHVHADHATGLEALPGAFPIGQVWAALDPHTTESSVRVMDLFAAYRVPVYVPKPGDRYDLGRLQLSVEGPLRRYDSANDQSVVITVRGPSASMLLAGDIETVAQAELSHLEADVLKVPHQGAATSDAVWLQSVDAELAVISVGPNQFGHPSPWVIEVLEDSGARVLRTDEMGDILVPLG